MTKGLVITWDLIAKIAGGITAVIVLVAMLGNGALWALTHHYDDRYILVVEALGTELRKIDREIRKLEKDPDSDPDDIEFLYEQRQEIQDDIDA